MVNTRIQDSLQWFYDVVVNHKSLVATWKSIYCQMVWTTRRRKTDHRNQWCVQWQEILVDHDMLMDDVMVTVMFILTTVQGQKQPAVRSDT